MTGIDWLILFLYFVFVLGIGVALRGRMKTSTDFFLAGRAIPAWVCGLAFLSANLGAQEVIGMGASGAKYGIATSHFYWIGAIPAMVFVGIFMMPFYYGSRARSVPEYLRLRFDEKTRGLNAISFAIMTVFSSGISMYAMAKLIQTLHVFDQPFHNVGVGPQWLFHIGILTSAVVVLVYILLGGLTSAIYNEVLQFFLIVAGFLPLSWLGLRNIAGWAGLKARLDPSFTHSWSGMGSPATNRLGVEWFGLVMGLGFVLSFGYWCTDFRHGGQLHERRSQDAADWRVSKNAFSLPCDFARHHRRGAPQSVGDKDLLRRRSVPRSWAHPLQDGRDHGRPGN